MKAIALQVIVEQTGRLQINAPVDLPSGSYEAIIVLNETTQCSPLPTAFRAGTALI